MSDKNFVLSLVLKASDKMSAVIKSACTQSDADFEKLNKKLEEAAGKFEKFGKKAVIFGTSLTAAAGINIKTAGDFEQGMNNVATLIDTNTESLDNMKREVLNIAKSSPKAIGDLTDALYSIRSASISA